MTIQRSTVEIDAGQPVERVAEKFIASLGGNAPAAVAELMLIVRALVNENEALAAAASSGYARRSLLHHWTDRLP